MATQYTRGKVGVIRHGNASVGQLTDWAMSIEAAEVELTTIGDDWATFCQGAKRWGATANFVLDMTETQGQRSLINELLTGDGISASVMLFYAEDGTTTDGYFSGTALISAANPSNPGNDDVIRCGITIRGTGALTFTDGTG